MNPNEQSRINAIISYFFLGPIFLFAKGGTPLADPFVRAHAKKSSVITAIFLVVLCLYFLIREYISWSIPGLGIDLRTIILIGLLGTTIFFLLKGAYMAHLGGAADELHLDHIDTMRGLTQISGVYTVDTEEEKIRIIMSMIPLFGILVSSRYPDHALITRGRILGSTLFFLYILAVLSTSSGSFVSVIILIIGIAVVVIEAVYVTLYSRFITWGILDRLPSSSELEAIVFASFGQIIEFSRVSMGKEKGMSFHERYESLLSRGETKSESTPPYFMPPGLLGLPFWNLFGIPSLFIEKYKPYRTLVIQGIIITCIISIFWFIWNDWSSPWLLLLLFPIVHIIVYAPGDLATRAPGIGLPFLLRDIIASLSSRRNLSNSESFTYPTPGSSETESKAQ